MPDQTLPTQTSPAVKAANPPSHLRQEYETQQALLNAQPALTQRFLEAQARKLADALTQRERAASPLRPAGQSGGGCGLF